MIFMIQAIKRIIVYIILIISLIILILFFSGYISIYSKENFERSYSQFHSINKKDEYIIAEEVNQVTFNISEYKYILGDFPIGDSEVDLSLVANFKYFINFSELTHELYERTLIINIPKLYLSTPVAINTGSIKQKGERFMLGASPEKLYEKLLSQVSGKLKTIGEAQKNNVRDKAAQSMAENLNDFLSNNNSSGHYDIIKVVFNDDMKDAIRLYEFNNSFCPQKLCKFELEFLDGKTIVIE